MGIAWIVHQLLPSDIRVISRINQELSFHQTVIGLRAQRQQVLAGNIANADTPNFKARDFDFSKALKEAVAGRSSAAMQPVRTDSRHLGPNRGPDAGQARLGYRVPLQPSVDGNTVDMDVERAQFSENAMQYEASLTFLSGKIKTLMSAIQGQ